MLAEVLDLVVYPDPSGVFVDGTFGRGGHSRGMLSALGPAGRLHGLDMDPHAVEVHEGGVHGEGIMGCMGGHGEAEGRAAGPLHAYRACCGPTTCGSLLPRT